MIYFSPIRILLVVFALLVFGQGQGYAQNSTQDSGSQKITRLTLEARLTKEGQRIENGLEWRIFGQNLGPDGKLPLLASAFGGTKSFDITQGDYLVCGMREAEEKTVNMRRLGSRDQKSYELDEAIAALVDEAIPPDLKRLAAE